MTMRKSSFGGVHLKLAQLFHHHRKYIAFAELSWILLFCTYIAPFISWFLKMLYEHVKGSDSSHVQLLTSLCLESGEGICFKTAFYREWGNLSSDTKIRQSLGSFPCHKSRLNNVFSKYLLSTYCVPATVLSVGDAKVPLICPLPLKNAV